MSLFAYLSVFRQVINRTKSKCNRIIYLAYKICNRQSNSSVTAVKPLEMYRLTFPPLCLQAQASGLASKKQKSTHAGSGTVSSDGTTVTNTASECPPPGHVTLRAGVK